MRHAVRLLARQRAVPDAAGAAPRRAGRGAADADRARTAGTCARSWRCSAASPTQALLSRARLRRARRRCAPSPARPRAEHPAPSRSTAPRATRSPRRGSAGRSTRRRAERRRRRGDRRLPRRPARRAARRPRLLCLAFEEDFAVIDGASATIPWLAVCLPSRWAPEDKVGRHFAEVHAPVADNALLIAAERHRWRGSSPATSAGSASSGRSRADPRLHQHPARGGADWPARRGRRRRARRARLLSHRAPDLHPDRRQRPGDLHDPRRQRAARRRGDDAPTRARRLHDAIASMSPGGARLPRPRRPCAIACSPGWRRARAPRRRADEDGADRRRRGSSSTTTARRARPSTATSTTRARARSRRRATSSSTATRLPRAGAAASASSSSRPASASATTSSPPGRRGATIRERCRQLHFVSIEAVAADARRPRVARRATRRSRRWPPSSRAHWPPLTCNLHRIALRRRPASSCCSPSATSTPGCRSWSPTSTPSSSTASRRRAIRRCGTRALFKAMARLAAPGRDGRDLERGARGSRRPARRRLRGRERARQRRQARHHARPLRAALHAAAVAAARQRSRVAAATRAIGRRDGRRAAPVVIVGAGLAGCALARALAERGCASLVARARRGDRRAKARAMPPALFHGVVHRGDGRHARFHRAAALAARRRRRARRSPRTACAAASPGCCASRRGRDRAEMQALVDALGLPADYVEALDRRRRRAALAGVRLSSPGLALPGRRLGRSARPRPRLARARRRQRSSCALRLRGRVAARASTAAGSFSTPPARRSRRRRWSSSATATARSRCSVAAWPIRRQRGQISARRRARRWPPTAAAAPADRRRRLRRCPRSTARSGSARARRGTTPTRRCAATTSSANLDRLAGAARPAPRRLRSIGSAAGSACAGRADDRLPIIGAVPRQRRREHGLGLRRRALAAASISRASSRGRRGSSCVARSARAASRRRRSAPRCWPRRSPARRCRSRPTCSMRSTRRAS